MQLPDQMNQELTDAVLQSGITDIRFTGGGSINQAAALTAEDGRQVFVKWKAGAPKGFFEAEAAGLAALRESGAIAVPEVLHISKRSNPCFLVLEFLKPGSRSEEAEEELGGSLAELHRTSAEAFGFNEDNFIGETPQVNGWSSDWGEFFVESRLAFQLRLGEECGWLKSRYRRVFEDCRSSIVQCLNEHQEPPALLHGDLWGGNVFWSAHGPVLIDPAVYYGNREADLAFTELFGGFSAPFYSAYYEANPLRPGHEQRKPILNLYHLLNHANLFGAPYCASAEQVILSLHESL